MRSRLAFSLAVAFAAALILTACRVAPPGDALVQRLDAATQRALVFTSAGIGSIRPHVRVRNVGEPGSEVRVTMELPPGMSASLASATLRAGEFVDITLSASGASRDAIVVVRTDGRANAVPVRVVADDGVICAPGTTLASNATLGVGATDGAALLPPLEPEGLEVVVTYASEALRATSLPEVARRQVADRALAAAAAQLVRPGGLGEHDLVIVPDAAALERLRRAPGVRHVAPNVAVFRSQLPNDPELGKQWWVSSFGVAQGWAVQAGTSGGDPVVVAIVDDGVNTDHQDLRDELVPGCDVFDFDGDVRAASHHGSHVAGLALATGDNALDIAGIAYGPAVRLLPVKIFPNDPGGNGTLDSVLRGLRWSAGHSVAGLAPNAYPADVINMSFGFGRAPGASVVAVLQQTVNELLDADADQRPVLIAAAGNQRSGESTSAGVEYPARLDGVLAVGSVDADARRSAFSYYGPGLDLMAPGGSAPTGFCGSGGRPAGMLSTGSGSSSQLVCLQGTSMATPIVSGTVALLLLHEPPLRNDPEAVAAHLKATAWSDAVWIDPSDPANEYGAGIVCLDAVLGAGTACGGAP